jgi:uncharacterized LabA/DUF88 family protein
MKQRVLIIIDGSNFYYKLKELKLERTLKLDFAEMVDFLSDSDRSVEACYYVGRIRQDKTKKSKQLFDAQQKLLGSLKKSGVKYRFGYLLKTNGVFHEKGVDVQMAVDMVVGAYENLYDRLVLISSDTDLAPAIAKVRAKGKTVEYVGFSHNPSVAMVSFCSQSRLLTKTDLEKLF